MDRQLSWDDVAPHLTGLANAATASSDGTPHVSVVAAVVDGDSIWITTRRSSGKAINIAENPRIALMFRPGSEAYVSGTVEIVDDADEKRRRWSGFFPYDATSFFGAAGGRRRGAAQGSPDRRDRDDPGRVGAPPPDLARVTVPPAPGRARRGRHVITS